LLGKFYEEEVAKKFSVNAIRLMVDRYLLKDENGKLIEGPKQMFERVAALIVIPDILYDPEIYDKEGKQTVKPKESFNPEEFEGKLGLKKTKDGYLVKWNRYHLERMKYLYDYLNTRGNMKVSWSELLKKIQNGDFDKYYDNYLKYYNLMVQKKFLPNSPTLFNAGARLGQLSACFVLPIDDDMKSIMECATNAALVFKSGGGVGVNFSQLRPEGDVVASTAGVASGPVSFMKIIDTVTDVVKQGGKRRGANLGVLEIWHPDIVKFIHSKEVEGILENFNISVMITPDFWEYYEKNIDYPLLNPRILRKYNVPLPGEKDFNKEKIPKEAIVTYINPRNLLEEISYMAWKTGDPGCLFMDHLNSNNLLYNYKGPIRSTNPCGEQPLYPYESCNLGSINLYAMIKFEDGKAYFDWNEFKETIIWSYRFLDNVIDVNNYPIKEIEENTKASRRVGLGYMGLADSMYALGIPYASEEGFRFIMKISEWLTYYSMLESIERAKERGTFPLYKYSEYENGKLPVDGYYNKDLWTLDWDYLVREIKKYGIRNLTVTTIAPTGSISMLIDVSSGIEPQYALVYEKRVTAGNFYYVDIELERQLKMRGLYREEILKKIAENGGSLLGIEEIPIDLKKVFLTALDIPWWDHVRAQASSQIWITNTISKTINMPNWMTKEDVLGAYLFAYKLRCRGITVFRDGCKSKQVYYTSAEASKKRMEEYIKMINEGIIENKTMNILKDFKIELPSWFYSITSEKDIKINFLDKNLDKKSEKNIKKLDKCPNCNGERLISQSGCLVCLDCGWSLCLSS
ncbi:MAG: adenosylcobalamin-dependent ribonucleoside-diphosphate reductase, partial [Nanopusillaceae archaeon]